MERLRIAHVDGPPLRRTLVAPCEHAQARQGELTDPPGVATHVGRGAWDVAFLVEG